MRTQATIRIGLAVAAGAIIAGCANEGASPASSPSASAPAPSVASSPTLPPASPEGTTPGTGAPSATPPTGKPLPTITLTDKPPKEPTDKQPNTGWVAGMVTRGGKGPCYGLIADDGQRYALYSTAGTELAQGSRVKVKLETTKLRIYCGTGTLMAMTDAETIK
ncbi:hypothetical protein [Actinoplanes xinjiangensis]|uniref:hypothetical protein n=1 Tax=Actinoplanes xinjiangensis TaxID=512350 RepID=UPI00344216F0